MPPKASTKRARAPTVSDTQPSKRQAAAASKPAVDLNVALATLSDTSLRQLVSAQINLEPTSDLAEAIRNEYTRIIAQRSATVVDFDHHSKSVWRELNLSHSKKSSRWQFEAAGDAEGVVSDAIRSISQTATESGANKGTRENALTTLRKIGKTICLAGDQLGSEVRDGYCCTELVGAMKAVMEGMSMAEREAFFEAGDFVEKLEELEQLSEGYGIMTGLSELFDLAGYGEEDED
ncbi:uncharacterized protein AB675_6024 [Cyphellophora attinorum]|uniref:Uncharacterized protein n=1 Tax=Cyphellophora attinorum TaxID=1664694 RepID=A0A0N1H060_9EURO|nr:uncharacterized protein AB675_6024 [Phialophora attinorum]KPI36984.1 hypothetical protein AB675_6024 [Phialophora attinorum]